MNLRCKKFEGNVEVSGKASRLHGFQSITRMQSFLLLSTIIVLTNGQFLQARYHSIDIGAATTEKRTRIRYTGIGVHRHKHRDNLFVRPFDEQLHHEKLIDENRLLCSKEPRILVCRPVLMRIVYQQQQKRL